MPTNSIEEDNNFGIDINRIRKYSGGFNWSNDLSDTTDGFSFVDTIASLVNNKEYLRGYQDFHSDYTTNENYIWKTLSAIGQDCTETIYENILNYIDNVSNVDLCKVVALKSIIKMLGINYNVFDNIDGIPIEILNLMDLLSINKSYLLRSKIFNNYFVTELKSSGCIEGGNYDIQLSSFTSANETSSLYTSEDSVNQAILSGYTDISSIMVNGTTFNDNTYEVFLDTLYVNLLQKFINLKYTDAENDIENEYNSDKNGIIWKYLINELLSETIDSDVVIEDSYDKQIKELKLKYKIDKRFNVDELVTNILDGKDDLDNYSPNEKEILNIEIARRYNSYTAQKKYDQKYQRIAYNLTRYSWYREQKVKEYINFVNYQYNKLLVEENIAQELAGSGDVTIQEYDKDPNYFVIDQTSQNYLISYDQNSLDGSHSINGSVVSQIAKLLRKQTIEIARVREKIKIHMQKTYMKGTFLLLSYMINEYLIYNIVDKYGDKFQDNKTADTLGDIIEQSINSGNNINLIEYIDTTDYYNIERDNDVSALNGDTTIKKYWDNQYSSMKTNTNDLPFDEIENFYINQLKLGTNHNVDNLQEFLSVIFEYGANSMYYPLSSEHNEVVRADVGRSVYDMIYNTSNMELNVVPTNENELGISDESIIGQTYLVNMTNVAVDGMIFYGDVLGNNVSKTVYDNNITEYVITGFVTNGVISDKSINTTLCCNVVFRQISSNSIYSSRDKYFIDPSVYDDGSDKYENYVISGYLTNSNILSNMLFYTVIGTYEDGMLNIDSRYLPPDSGYGVTDVYIQSFVAKDTGGNEILSSLVDDDIILEFVVKNKGDTQSDNLDATITLDNENKDTIAVINLGRIASNSTTTQRHTIKGGAFRNNTIQTFILNIGMLSKRLTIDIKSVLNSEQEDGEDTPIIPSISVETNRINQNITMSNEESNEFFNKYIGIDEKATEGFYNHKNLAHPSYQIHPYLYNFMKYSNFVYPIENLFYTVFDKTYDQTIINYGVDNIIGEYGNIIDLWKSEFFDYSGYKTEYEYSNHLTESNTNIATELVDFDGLFYKPALIALMNDEEAFIKGILNNTNIYYRHLNLVKKDREKIANQVEQYKKLICETISHMENPLSNDHDEYDIYKYAKDSNENTILLLKNYNYLYINLSSQTSDSIGVVNDVNELSSHTTMKLGTVGYVYNNGEYDKYVLNSTVGNISKQWKYVERFKPLYADKKNTPGELWIRAKDHPFAFPAFDFQDRTVDVSFFNTKDSSFTEDKKLNGYIKLMNEYFKTQKNKYDTSHSNVDIKDITTENYRIFKDSIGTYLRVFYDMEMNVIRSTILLNVPYKTGGYTSIDKQPELAHRNYYNTDIIVGVIRTDYDYTANETVYSFTSDLYNNVNIDNIPNPRLNITDEKYLTNFYEFIGFMQFNDYIYCLFNKKYKNPNEFPDKRFIIRPIAYRYNRKLETYRELVVNEAKGIYFNISREPNANHVVFTHNDNGVVTFAYASGIKNYENKEDVEKDTWVSFPEYTNMVEDLQNTENHGMISSYNVASDLLQNIDRTNYIYNSFDSFSNHIVVINCTFNSKNLSLRDIRYYNLNNSIGYIPIYTNINGNVRLYKNKNYKDKTSYNIELLGQERTEDTVINIIDTNAPVSYGRVTENYSLVSKYEDKSDDIKIMSNNSEFAYFEYDFQLSDIIRGARDTYPDIRLPENKDKTIEECTTKVQLEAIRDYKFIIYNSDYISKPIFLGDFVYNNRDKIINDYVKNPENSLKTNGNIIIGPNSSSSNDLKQFNHINGVSSMNCGISYLNTTFTDEHGETMFLPTKVTISGYMDSIDSKDKIIREDKFIFLTYKNNSRTAYDNYHIFENANSQLIKLNDAIIDYIDFNTMTNISSYSIYGVEPFVNQNKEAEDYSEMSAILEFKYSERDPFNAEYPTLYEIGGEQFTYEKSSDYVFYISLDGYDTTEIQNVDIQRYYKDRNGGIINHITFDTNNIEFKDFYDKAMTLKVSYSVEDVKENDIVVGNEIVLYFNYDNYNETPYRSVEFEYNELDNSILPKPPTVKTESVEDISNTYLKLRPGEFGNLDIRVDYLAYGDILDNQYEQSIVGKESRILHSYEVLNVSDNKPKFIIKRIKTDVNK